MFHYEENFLLSRSFVALIFSCAVMMSESDVVTAQEFPNKAVRIVTSEAGGNFDMVARLIAHGMTGAFDQPVIVDNRAGVIAVESVE